MSILHSLIFFGAPRSEIDSNDLNDRVNLERAKIYFSHTKISLLSLFLGLVIGVVLLDFFEVSWTLITLWSLALSALGIVLFRYEQQVHAVTLTPQNVGILIAKRLGISFGIALVWGLFIPLMPESSKVAYTFSYIAMSTFVHIGFLSFSLIPVQFSVNFLGVLLPLEVTLIGKYFKTDDPFFAILAAIFMLCEGVLFLKALVNATTAVRVIVLNEKLKDEILASAEAKKRIEYLAYHDHLTGVWNRRYIENFIDALRKERQTFGIILLDMNYFKEINDTYGHAFGDELLIGFVQTIQPTLPKSACLGRLGGDEFIVVLRECHSYTTLEETMFTLKALLKKVYTINTVEITSSTSVGAALYPIDANDVEALIRLADERMYADKHNDHRVFNP